LKIKKGIKILLGPSTFSAIDKSPLTRLLEAGFEIIENPYKRKLTKKELMDLLPGVKGIIAGLEPLDREVLEMSELKVISRCGSGLSNIDLDVAKELGIIVRSTPLGPTTAVAELTIGCLIVLLRHVIQMNNALHRHEWSKLTGRQLKGMEVAVIGFGNIGQTVGKLLLSFDAKVYAVDPRFSGIINGVPIIKLDEALSRADVITIHSSGEKCLLGEREFSLMKKGVFLLNGARGELVDEYALKQALDNGWVSGAWLDTFKEEPYSGILCGHERVVLTPHIGSYTLECRRDMEMEAVENLIGAFK
jgi:D-3-phosphoglycerate dehydrogenase